MGTSAVEESASERASFPSASKPEPTRVCGRCGSQISTEYNYCYRCGIFVKATSSRASSGEGRIVHMLRNIGRALKPDSRPVRIVYHRVSDSSSPLSATSNAAPSAKPRTTGATSSTASVKPSTIETPRPRVRASVKVPGADGWRWEIAEERTTDSKKCPSCGAWNRLESWKCSKCHREFFG